ncbi:MAG: SET domain-containing protein [Planctomycetes bacterium]|nr:SET domain-containing protein [Planctomycetota bacterium]
MLHPDVELRLVDPVIGHGLFATRFIPRGTITWVMCRLEQVFDTAALSGLGPAYSAYLDKYAYANEQGDKILCCDLGRYMNHSCDPSTLTLPGTEIEIALRDIHPGDQITDDYGTLNLAHELTCRCGSANCRGVVRREDMPIHQERWESLIEGVLPLVRQTPQPLEAFLHEGLETRIAELAGLLSTARTS